MTPEFLDVEGDDEPARRHLFRISSSTGRLDCFDVQCESGPASDIMRRRQKHKARLMIGRSGADLRCSLPSCRQSFEVPTQTRRGRPSQKCFLPKSYRLSLERVPKVKIGHVLCCCFVVALQWGLLCNQRHRTLLIVAQCCCGVKTGLIALLPSHRSFCKVYVYVVAIFKVSRSVNVCLEELRRTALYWADGESTKLAGAFQEEGGQRRTRPVGNTVQSAA